MIFLGKRIQGDESTDTGLEKCPETKNQAVPYSQGRKKWAAASGPHCRSGDRVQGSAPDCQVQLKQLDSWTFPKAKVPILNKASVSVIGNRAFHTA